MQAHAVWTGRILSAVMVLGVVAVPARGQAGGGPGAAALAEEDGRLNAAYKERISQIGSSADLAHLREEEREWVRGRDKQCGKAVDCLTRVTRDRADLLQKQVMAATGATKAGETIPLELWGKWIVRKVLPTETISCWDNAQARALVGTELEYKPDSFRWKKKQVKNLGAKTTTVTAKEFAEDNSGGGAIDSRVSFGQLGIKTATVQQIAIRHPDVVMGAGDGAGEMPGETVLLSSPGHLIFSVCNVYFEASRPELE